MSGPAASRLLGLERHSAPPLAFLGDELALVADGANWAALGPEELQHRLDTPGLAQCAPPRSSRRAGEVLATEDPEASRTEDDWEERLRALLEEQLAAADAALRRARGRASVAHRALQRARQERARAEKDGRAELSQARRDFEAAEKRAAANARWLREGAGRAEASLDAARAELEGVRLEAALAEEQAAVLLAEAREAAPLAPGPVGTLGAGRQQGAAAGARPGRAAEARARHASGGGRAGAGAETRRRTAVSAAEAAEVQAVQTELSEELSLAAAWKASVARTTEELAAARAELLHLREEAVTRTAGTSEQPNGNEVRRRDEGSRHHAGRVRAALCHRGAPAQEAAAHEAELALLEEARLRLREACAAGDAALQGAQAAREAAEREVQLLRTRGVAGAVASPLHGEARSPQPASGHPSAALSPPSGGSAASAAVAPLGGWPSEAAGCGGEAEEARRLRERMRRLLGEAAEQERALHVLQGAGSTPPPPAVDAAPARPVAPPAPRSGGSPGPWPCPASPSGGVGAAGTPPPHAEADRGEACVASARLASPGNPGPRPRPAAPGDALGGLPAMPSDNAEAET